MKAQMKYMFIKNIGFFSLTLLLATSPHAISDPWVCLPESGAVRLEGSESYSTIQGIDLKFILKSTNGEQENKSHRSYEFRLFGEDAILQVCKSEFDSQGNLQCISESGVLSFNKESLLFEYYDHGDSLKKTIETKTSNVLIGGQCSPF